MVAAALSPSAIRAPPMAWPMSCAKHGDKDRSTQHNTSATTLMPATGLLDRGSSSLEGSLTVVIVVVADPADSAAEGVKLVFTDERPVFSFVGDASADLEGDVAEGVIATAIDEEEADMFCEAVGTDEVLTQPTWLLLNEVSSIMWRCGGKHGNESNGIQVVAGGQQKP